MVILGIETSCDETSAAVLKITDKKLDLLSNVIASSLSLHKETGGIIPEVAAREQIKYIIPVISEALKKARIEREEIDKIAVTVGPGLIGSLLVGVETAKTFSYILNKPLIPVNHLYGHIYANFINENQKSKNIEFPAIALVVSGGHTDLVLIRNHGDLTWLGGTRDDAAGEAFDKIGRLLDLDYPAGPLIETLANKGNTDFYHFPRPLHDSKDFDFSFSGLKSAVLREVEKIRLNEKRISEENLINICFSAETAIFDIIIQKTLKACSEFKAKSLLLGGGVAANQTLRKKFELKIENSKLKIPLFIPEKRLCTDNAGMIAAAAYYNNLEAPFEKVDANPELYFD